MPSDSSYFLQGTNRRLPVTTGSMLGRGRVAEVFEIREPPEAASLALKLFHGPLPDEITRLVDFAKLRRLDQLVPMGVSEDDSFPLVACPKCLVYDRPDATTPIGLAVLRTDTVRFLPLSSWMQSSRVQRDLKFCVTAATRLAEALEAIHGCGFVVGDVSGSNVLVDADGFCNLIDVDSFGVTAPGGGLILSPKFATNNFFAPEMPTEGPSLASDRFSLGLIATQFLLGGMHPFGGSHRTEQRDHVQGNISTRDSWLFAPESFNLPPECGPHLGIQCIPQWVHDSVRKALVGVPEERPAAADWRIVLLRAHTQIAPCDSCGSDRFRGAVCRTCGDGARLGRAGARRRNAAATSRRQSPVPAAEAKRSPAAEAPPPEDGPDRPPRSSRPSSVGWPARSARARWVPIVCAVVLAALLVAVLIALQ